MEDTYTIKREKNGMFVYIPGLEPKFKVGDVLAIYEFYSDYEGEIVFGEVKSVEFDNDMDDWCYTFADDSIEDEQYLLNEQAYVKQIKTKQNENRRH